MVKTLCITRDNTTPKGKPRVMFTCHPKDFDVSFEKIAKDIFTTHDCAIYYTEDMSAELDDQDMETYLNRCNLIVIPITSNFLRFESRAKDLDFPYAIQNGIPVLPILMEQGVEELYASHELFFDIQYLTPFSTDSTEIPYEEKLIKYLDTVLISEEMGRRIRAAFDAYIFLSYRKKDRYFANELMRMIHSNPECQNIAIWFDEFLIPGESFSDAIHVMLEKSELFTLLVTPHLLEKRIDQTGEESDNYILSVELPLAKRKGKKILAAEMEQTDKEALEKNDIFDCVDARNEAEFRSRLLQSISRIATAPDDNSPEHNFLIGLAYLDGVDVEVNREKGIQLIQSVAEAGFEEAMHMMGHIYQMGKGVPKSYYRAKEWYKKYLESKLINTNCAEEIGSLIESYDEYCDFLLDHFVLDYSIFVNNTMLPYVESAVQNRDLPEQNREDLLFWLCKSYYRSVQADMKRDADDHNAKWYASLVKKHLLQIRDLHKLEVLEDCLAYMERTAAFWGDYIAASNESKQIITEGYPNISENEIVAAVSLCEENYNGNPNEETLALWINALEDALDYYQKISDEIQYIKYTSEYLIQKEKQFVLDPDDIDAIDIVLGYDDFVQFLIDKEKWNDAIEILNRKIKFLEYLQEIGGRYNFDYSASLALLSELLERLGM